MTLLVRKHYNSFMDRKSALNILDLDPDASFEAAKQAYRTLAKQHHPDVAGLISDDNEMKEINLAFCYLTPILRAQDKLRAEKKAQSKTKIKTKVKAKTEAATEAKAKVKSASSTADKEKASSTKEDTKARDTKESGYKRFYSRLKRWIRGNSSIRGKAQAQTGQTFSSAQTPKRPLKTDVKFEKIFRKVNGGVISPDKGKPKQRKVRPVGKKQRPVYENYQHYMALKKKMRAARKKRQGSLNVSRVEAIDPIRPVKAVQRDDF